MRRCLLYFFLTLLVLFVFSSPSIAAERILSEQDRSLYREIFTLQDAENFKAADKKIALLKNKILMSYVEAQRYLSKTYVTSKKELSDWLRKYPGHPDAYKIYNLAVKKKVKPPVPKPVNPDSPRRSCSDSRGFDPLELIYNRKMAHLSGAKRKDADYRMRVIRTHIIKGKTKAAYQMLTHKDTVAVFRPIDYDAASTSLAFLYFTDKEYDRGIELLVPAIKRSGKQLPISSWVLGLLYWQKNEYSKAYAVFKEAADLSRSSPELKSAAAYWASRCALRLKKYTDVQNMLEMAASQPQTFYGLIAERVLGDDKGYSYFRPTTKVKGGNTQKQRVLALMEIGHQDKAMSKLRMLYLAGHKEAEELILMLEEDPVYAGTLDRAIAFGGRVALDTGRTIYYPVPEWEPYGGWQIDRALVYAFIRQESCFNQDAKSKVGAQGLMQLMPQTANLIARMMNIDINRKRLYEPELNIAFGQKYINHLTMFPQINKNLIFIATSYNAGPGNLIKWIRTVDHRNDPLAFIEAMPSRETRNFVKRVLTNFWIYRSLLDQDNPSIDEIIHGNWPMYQEQDLRDFFPTAASGTPIIPASAVRVVDPLRDLPDLEGASGPLTDTKTEEEIEALPTHEEDDDI